MGRITNPEAISPDSLRIPFYPLTVPAKMVVKSLSCPTASQKYKPFFFSSEIQEFTLQKMQKNAIIYS